MAEAPFWGSQFSDPKRKFRWIVEFTTTGGGRSNALQLAAKNVKKPTFEIGSTPHKWLNHTFFFPARLEWKEIQLTLVDVGGEEDITTIINDLLELAGYNPPVTAAACFRALTKEDSVSAFGNKFQIKQLDGDGQPNEVWVLTNPWIKSVDYGELNYESDDLVEITLTIQYDYAEKDPSVTGGANNISVRVT